MSHISASTAAQDTHVTRPPQPPVVPLPSRNLIRVVVLVVVAGIVGALIASRPNTDPEAMAAQVRAYSDKFQYEDALRTAQDALDIVKAGGYPDEYVAKFYLLRAQMWVNVYEWDFALSDFNSAITLAPTYPEAYYLRGLFFSNLSMGGGIEQIDLAIADFEAVVALTTGIYAELSQTAISNLLQQRAVLSAP